MDASDETGLNIKSPVAGQDSGPLGANLAGPQTGAVVGQVPPPQQSVLAAPEESEELDQEWIDKAKDIVEKTKNDPFLQSRELSRVKAGYLKARYDKDLKLDEDIAQ